MVLNTRTGGVKPPVFKKGENMKYLILRDTIADGNIVKAGDVVELSQETGNVLVQYNKAEIFKEDSTKKTDRSVGLKTSEKPKLKKRKGK